MKHLELFFLFLLFSIHGHASGYYNTNFMRKTPNLKFTTNPQTLFASVCSQAVTIRSYIGSTPTNVTAPLTINLNTTGGITIYSDFTCNTPVTSVTIPVGASTASFYFVSDTVGTANISTVATPTYTSINQNETFTTNPFIWTGGGANALWSTAANWSGGAVPGGGSSHAVFNHVCVTNCSPIISSNISIGTLRMANGYTGTITQNPGVTMLIQVNWSQLSGNFVGSDSSITLYSSYAGSGGSFTSTTGMLTVQNHFTITGTAFSHNSGTVRVGPSSGTISTGSTVFKDFNINGSGSQFSVIGTVFVDGDLTISDTHPSSGVLVTGTVSVKGNLIINNYGLRGDGTIKLVGSGNQAVTGSATACLPAFEIASTGGTVSYSGAMKFRSHYTYTSGTIDPGTTSVVFNPNYNTTSNIKVGSEQFNDVRFTANYGTYELTGTMNVNGNLVLEDVHNSVGHINNGTILLGGNLDAKQYGYRGTALIKLVGTGTQTVNGVSTALIPNIEFASTGTVNFTGSLRFYGDFLYTSGTVNPGSAAITFYTGYLGVVNLNSGPITFNDLIFQANYGTYNLTGTMIVNGNLILSDTNSSIGRINTGTIQVGGNLTTLNYGYLGSARIVMAGSTPASINQTSGRILPHLTITKTPGTTVTLGTDVSLNQVTGGDSLTVTSGSVDMAGRNLTIRTSLSLNGNTLIKNAGVLTVAGGVVGSGSLHGGTINP